MSADQNLADGAGGHAARYLAETADIARRIDPQQVESLVAELVKVRGRGGRLFFLGAGGSAANASHAAADFRKLAGFEAYAATENVAELTARTNDDGWETVHEAWLRGCRLGPADAIFVLSVGGGSRTPAVSAGLVRAVDHARSVGATVFGIVGRDGGYTAAHAHLALVVPVVNGAAVTPHTEAFQGVLWHLLVTHPALCTGSMTWESVAGVAQP